MAALNNMASFRLITLSTAITRCHVISLRYELQAQSYSFFMLNNIFPENTDRHASVLLFQANNIYENAPQCYFIRTLPILLKKNH